jgi:methylglyoxal synthase
MPQHLRIALVAHDAKKDALVAWAKQWEHWLARHPLLGTGSTLGQCAITGPFCRVDGALRCP